jgi:DNA polymerase-3 subunit gamma/tau
MTLYRTYRPQRFEDILGQPLAKRLLEQAIIRNQVAHAYLFTGPRGTGKTSSARIFARALCCLDRPENSAEPCNKCDNCLALLNNQAPDLIEIDAATHRQIDDIRALREEVPYPPLQLPRKIYIIDEAHMLTSDAFNAFLKTLEEPPSHVLFILATTEPHKLPITIRSRCQTVRFLPGSTKAVSDKIRYILDAEKIKSEDGVAELIAEHAEGGFRDAETVLDYLLTQHRTLTVVDVRQTLGLVESKQLEEIVDGLINGDSSPGLKALASLTGTEIGLERFSRQLLQVIRQRILTGNTADPLLRRALRELLEASILLKSSPLPGLPLELAFLTIAAQASGQSEEHTPSRKEGAKETPSTPREIEKTSPPVMPAAKAPSTPVIQVNPQPIVSSEPTVPVIELREKNAPLPDIRKAWKEVADRVVAKNVLLGQVLKETTVHSAERGIIHVMVRFPFHADKLQEKKNHALICSILEELLGAPWQPNYRTTVSGTKVARAKRIASGDKPEISYLEGRNLVQDASAIFSS